MVRAQDSAIPAVWSLALRPVSPCGFRPVRALAGRVGLVDMGPGLYDSDMGSPEPGDDLGAPPSDFDENELGGPAPPPPPPPPPVPQVRS